MEEESFGPALPPHLLKKTSDDAVVNKVIGPSLPPNFVKADSDDSEEEEINIGPLPPGVEPSSRAQLELEERALEIKLNGIEAASGISQPDIKSREEWMTELPEVRKVSDLGLGARQFRQKEGPDFSDRSSWTDTPQSKLEKEKSKNSGKSSESTNFEAKLTKDRDKAMEKLKKKYEKEHKREKSLLELHQDKLKKKKKKDKKEKERRPFSREVDLAVNKFDESRKQAAIKKSQLLDGRFSAGSSKFL